MRDRIANTWSMAVVVSAVALWLSLVPAAHGAAEWEWTKGQGWTEGAGKPRETAKEQLQYAMQLERKGEYRSAAKQYFLCVRIFSASDEAGIALQRLAKCLFETENFYQSYKAIEQVIESYPRTGRLGDLLGVEYKIGKKLLRGARISQLETDENAAKAQSRRAAAEVFQSIVMHDPYGKYAPYALLGLGDSHLLLSEPKEARTHYERLLRDFSKSPLVDRARLGITRAKVMEGQADPTEVEHMVKQFRNKAEDGAEGEASLDEGLRDLEEMEAAKMWKSSEFYHRRGTPETYNAWIFSLQEIARRYPRTSYAAKAREELTRAGEEAPPAKSRFLPDLGKVNLIPTFLKRDKKKPEFVTPQRGDDAVKTDIVMGDVPGVVPAATGTSTAAANPMAPTPVYGSAHERQTPEQDAQPLRVHDIDDGADPDELSPDLEDAPSTEIPSASPRIDPREDSVQPLQPIARTRRGVETPRRDSSGPSTRDAVDASPGLTPREMPERDISPAPDHTSAPSAHDPHSESSAGLLPAVRNRQKEQPVPHKQQTVSDSTPIQEEKEPIDLEKPSSGKSLPSGWELSEDFK